MNITQTASARSIERSTFLRKVYSHLLIAIFGFIGLEYVWFSTDVAQNVFNFVVEVNWLLIMGAFIGVSWLASRLADSTENKAIQYVGFGLYVFAESLIFIPLLYIAQYYAEGGVIERAGFITAGAFTALSAIVFFTKVDLRGWGKYLVWAGVVALVAIISSVIFGFELGTYFSVAMVGLAGASILHDTSKIMHEKNDEAYVGASLQLFASVALMFWYVLRLLSRR